MRRIVLGVAVVFVMVFAAIGVGFLDSSRAEEGRSIPIRVVRYYDSASSSLDLGDECGFSLDIFRFFLTDQQIVIRNENDTVIAVRTLDDGVYGQTDNARYECELETNIPVPDATFYTVYLGDERITAYSKDEFPIDPLKGVWITLD